MKLKLVLTALLSLGLLVNVSNAQFRKIPIEATNALKVKYPQATNVAWKGGLSTYKAAFDIDNVRHTAEFNSKGEWVRTERRLTYDKLPASVADGLHKSLYADWEHSELLQVDEKDKETEFRIRVKKSSFSGKYLYFNSTGRLLREGISIKS